MRSFYHPAFKRQRILEWYDWLAQLSADRDDWTMMNYGLVWSVERDGPLPPRLPEHLAERLSAQLYYKVATLDGPIADKDVLEVGSGRGGGANFLFPRLNPSAYVGLDRAPSAVALANARHAQPGLRYVVGDAEQLPFDPGSFDAVINVESCHAYGSSARFLREVRRVLRPGGAFLFCDFWPAAEVADLWAEMEAAGLVIEHAADITSEVLAALDERAPLLDQEMRAAVPADKLDAFRAFCVMPGTLPYAAFKTRSELYVLCRARAPA